jgi:hypothetical protein
MANIELDGANKKIKVDSGDLTLDVPGDIILDADGADLVFADGGTNILKVTNSSSDVVFQPQVDAKDIIFKQYDGTTVATVEDNATFNIPASKLAIGGTAVTSTAAELNILDGVTSTAAELNILDGVTSTAAELNIVDGNTNATSTTIADADRVVLNDNGTMVQAAVTDLKTYIGGGGLVHINTISISSSTADATFLHGTNDVVLNDGTYENFLIIGSGIQVGTDDESIRVSFSIDNGSNYNAQTYRATDQVEMTQSGSSGSASQGAQSVAGATSLAGAVGNNSGNTFMFTMFLFNLNSTTMKKTALVEALEEQHNLIYKKRSSFITIAEKTAAIDGIRFNCNAGTFSKATFRLYGITNG